MSVARLLLLAAVLMPGVAYAAEPAALSKARALYNAGSYDAAIEAAQAAQKDPKAADAAALVIARARLERFRLAPQPSELATARELLAGVRANMLTPRDQLDLLIGLGQTLYLGEAFGPAGEIFDTALARASALTAAERSKVLDWWATSLDRDAQSRPPERRAAIFTRVVERMEEELRTDPGSAVGNYWLVVGARGAGDLDRAWDAAMAGWVRATLAPHTAMMLRSELDRIVVQALVPERARSRPAREQAEATAVLRSQWDQIKNGWK